MKKCPNCSAQIADNCRFCTECGKEITQANVCPHCGASVGEGDAFCQNCGKSLNENPGNEPITYEEEQPKSGFKKYLPYILGVILVLGIIGYFNSKDYKDVNENQSIVTDSIAIDESDKGNSSTNSNEVQDALHIILSKTINVADTLSDKDYVQLYFTDRYKSHYRNACKKADREGNEYPRLWWSYSDSDPEKFTIKNVRMTSSNEAKASVGMSSELYVADFEIILKKENGRWFIDNVDEKFIENNSESDIYNDNNREDTYYQENESSSSRTFYSEQIVIGYLANQSFRASDGLTMRVDGDGRLYVDGDYAGVLSVLRYNSTSALLRYGGGMYGEGKLTVQIVGDKFQLKDPTDGTVYYQR